MVAFARHRPAAALLLALHLAGCATWRSTPVGLEALIVTERPSSIRVTRSDGTALVVPHPTLVSDSLASVERECAPAFQDQPRACTEMSVVVMPVSDVQAVEVRRVNAGATATLVILGLLGVAVLDWCSTFSGSC